MICSLVGNETLDEIEAAVEEFRLKALPELESELLNLAQNQVSEGVKKRENQLVVVELKKGMSWSQQGTQALAILKVVELNGRPTEIFQTQTFAAYSSRQTLQVDFFYKVL